METNPFISEATLQLRHPLAQHVLERRAVARLNPEFVAPWLRSCRVKVLLVTDGGLDFGMGDFGLSAFVNLLKDDKRSYVQFDITLAHLRSNVNAEQMGSVLTGITNRIPNFRFDEPSHFTTTMYDQVWLFGIETAFHQSGYSFRNANRSTYPNNRLSDGELTTLNTFMDNGGGVFATGDHGALGRALCGSITRVRSMRHWDSFLNPFSVDEVSMTGSRRNDTNQIGHDPGSRFSDQSDDVPQTIQPRYYRARINAHLEARYPHPLLCSHLGVINVMPDHPHEGECMVPTDLKQIYPFGGTAEYPPSTADGTPVPPEIVATSMVVAGNTANMNLPNASALVKSPTVAHPFGGICAYDGHRAGVGRVVTDATWHHFVNVNLIGIFEGRGFDDLDRITPDHFSKHDGFMATAAGRLHLDKIKQYYVNIGVWISPPAKISCFNSTFWPRLVYSDRIMEAALVNPDVAISRISPDLFYSIGIHARDVLGRTAGQCQALKFILEIFYEYVPKLIPELDPWHPFPDSEFDKLLPRIDPMPMLHVALGYALVALRQAQPYAPEKLEDDFEEGMRKLAIEKASEGLKLALTYYQKEQAGFGKLLDNMAQQLKKRDK